MCLFYAPAAFAGLSRLPRAFDAAAAFEGPFSPAATHAGRAAMLGIMAFSAAHFIPGSVPFFFNA